MRVDTTAPVLLLGRGEGKNKSHKPIKTKVTPFPWSCGISLFSTQAPVMRCCSLNSLPAKPFPSSPSPPRVPWPDHVVDCRDSLLRFSESCGVGAQEALPSDEIPQPTQIP